VPATPRPLARFPRSGILSGGEVSEWLKVPISKIGVADEVTVGSNPTLSAESQSAVRVQLTASEELGAVRERLIRVYGRVA